MANCYCKLVGTYTVRPMDGFGMYIVIPGLDEGFLKTRQQKMCVFVKKVPRELTYISHLGTKKIIFKRKIYNSFAKK